jgi:hypothetical protein
MGTAQCYIQLKNIGIIYSYLMCSQAIEQNIFPKVLGTAQCSIAQSQRPRAID